MWDFDYKERFVLKNWCIWTVVLEKSLESPLDCKEIQPVHPKGNQSWIFIGRTDAEAETPILWLPDVKSWLISKDPDAGKDRGQKEKRASEDDMAGRPHRCNEHALGQTPEVSEGQGGLACCSPWGCKELDTTGWLNNNNNDSVFQEKFWHIKVPQYRLTEWWMSEWSIKFHCQETPNSLSPLTFWMRT